MTGMIYLESTYRASMVHSIEEAIEYIQWYSKKDIQEILANYMVANYYDYALHAIIRQNEVEYPVLYRGSRFKKELLVEGAIIDFGVEIISASLEMEMASKFAADDYLPERIYEECAEFGVVDADADNFEEQVNTLYGNVLFEIHKAKGIYLNSFFDEIHNFTKEHEVLIENRESKFRIISIEPHTFKVDEDEYPLTKVVVHAV